MKAVALAPGKVILFGEHFVVYGEPALVMAINRFVQVKVEDRSDNAIFISSSLGVSGLFEGDKFKPYTGGVEAKKILEPIRISAVATLKSVGERRGLNIEVTSSVPVAVGLGSSGASAVSTVAAVARLLEANLTNESIINISTEAERYVHINPSGIDQSASTYGGVIYYKKSERISCLKTNSIPVIVGSTGVSRSTGQLVDNVQIRMERLPKVMQPLISMAGKITIQAVDALKREDIAALGLLMDINHGLLTTLGVSSEILDRLVYAAKRGGALGAKLTGAGGGGCIVALSCLDAREAVAQAISKAGGIPIFVEKVDRGVFSWTDS